MKIQQLLDLILELWIVALYLLNHRATPSTDSIKRPFQ